METLDWTLIAPLLIVQVLLIFIALIDWMKQKKTKGPRILWLFIIIFVSVLGPVLYFILGKKE
ncbi:MAG TPA: PLD nuclease N-terminal domain-containing protein [Pseudogracilibacillus sp.]|nr:PLD nuclease N-terminal domain-containing protein [Pseudogracilibacillus sp.]